MIGDEARAQMLERPGGCPTRVIACVGGGSNSIGIFTPFVDDAEVELIGVEAAGEGIETGRHGAPLTVGGLPGCCTAPLGDHAGRGRADPRGALDLGRARLPGHRAPSTPGCATSGRARYVAVTDAQALEAFARTARLEGIIPALESAHALAWALANPGRELDVVCLSGRGDKDLAEALARLGRGEPAPSAARADRRGLRRRARRRPRGRADALPDGRLSRSRDLAEIGAGLRRGGADLVELGVPFSDPLADGPVIHAAATEALGAGATSAGVLEVAARDRRRGAGDRDVLREPDPRPRARAVRGRARAGRRQRADRP